MAEEKKENEELKKLKAENEQLRNVVQQLQQLNQRAGLQIESLRKTVKELSNLI